MFNSWIKKYTIEDNQMNIIDVDDRAVIPYEKIDECGDIFSELFSYAIEVSNTDDINTRVIFPKILFKENDILTTNIRLPEKTEEEKFKDLRYTIKSYKYILTLLLSSGIIPELKDVKENLKFELFKKDIENRANTLEFYLLNNSSKTPKSRSYYDGRLELDFHRLIQEMFILAKNGNIYCKWMLAFNTPLQIWFIANIQSIYYIWKDSSHPISNRAYLKCCSERVENINKDLNNYKCFIQSKSISAFDVMSGIMYSVAQLILTKTIPISNYYTNYIESIEKQAKALRRGIFNNINNVTNIT